MVVLLDTNHLFDDPFLTRPSLMALLAHRKAGGFSVAVPGVVVDEAVRQYRKHLHKRPERGPEELGARDDRGAPPAGDSVWLDRYRVRLIERLCELDVRVLPEPSPDEIERWRAERRKPFKAVGIINDGDARIWATALDVAKHDAVMLISRNHKDFGQDDHTLAPNLADDLRRLDLPEDRVLLRASTVRALGELGAPYVTRAHAADLLQRGRGKRQLLEKAQQAATDRLLDDESMLLLPFDVDLDPETVYMDGFEIEDLQVSAAYRVGDVIAVEASVFGEARVDVLLHRGDAYGLPDDSLIVIHDYDFNESYAEGQAELRLEILFETTVSEGREVSNLDFIGARPVDRPGP